MTPVLWQSAKGIKPMKPTLRIGMMLHPPVKRATIGNSKFKVIDGIQLNEIIEQVLVQAQAFIPASVAGKKIIIPQVFLLINPFGLFGKVGQVDKKAGKWFYQHMQFQQTENGFCFLNNQEFKIHLRSGPGG
jgi:hypothetical protein